MSTVRALTSARSTREQDEQRANAQVLRRLSERGRTIEQLARSLDWPGGRIGVGAVLRRLAVDGQAHERQGEWFAGPHPAPASSAPRILDAGAASDATPRLTYGPATLPAGGGVSRPPPVERPHELERVDESRLPSADLVHPASKPPADLVGEVGEPAVAGRVPGPAVLDLVLEDVRRHPESTARDLARRIGLLSGVVRAALHELRDAGCVRSTGRTSATRWSLSTPAPAEVPPSGGDDPVADEEDVEFDLPVCQVCGCTDSYCGECIDAQGYPCVWVAEGLCSRCVQEHAARRLEALAVEAERTAAHLRECVAALRAPAGAG